MLIYEVKLLYTHSRKLNHKQIYNLELHLLFLLTSIFAWLGNMRLLFIFRNKSLMEGTNFLTLKLLTQIVGLFWCNPLTSFLVHLVPSANLSIATFLTSLSGLSPIKKYYITLYNINYLRYKVYLVYFMRRLLCLWRLWWCV